MKKNEGYVAVLLAVTLLLVVVLVGSFKQELGRFSPLAIVIDPQTQTAQVTSAVGNVYHLSSCPASKDLYTEMMSEFNTRISSIGSLPSDATTNITVGGRPFLRTWVSGLNFSGINVNGAYAFTLISPRNAVTARHLHDPVPYGVYLGLKVTFKGSDGNLVTVSVAGIKDISGSDLDLVVFDQDLPSTVAFYPVLSKDNLVSYLPSTLPVLYSDQNGDYLIRQTTLTAGNLGSNGIGLGAYSPSSPFYPFGLELNGLTTPRTLIEGAYASDSSHPGFFLINNVLSIASTQTGPGMATMVGAHITELNQAMSDLDQSLPNPPSNSYQVTTIDLSCFDKYIPPPPTTIQPQTFSIDRSAPVNTVVGKVAYTRTNQSSTAGFTISSGNTGGAFAIDASGQITVANSSTLVSSNNSKFNLTISMSEIESGQTNLIQGSVTIKTLNGPPILALIGNTSVGANSILTFTISASDPDGDILTYSAGGLPSGATFDTSTGTFSWTPVLTQIGGHSITFQVADSDMATDSETIIVAVLRNPVTTPTPIVISAVSAGTPLQTSATITWTTDKVSSSQINYGLTSSYGSSTPLSSIWTKSHSQTLSNLLPKTTYHYRVSSNDPLNELGTSPDHTFSTAPDLVVGTTTPDVTSPMVTVFIIPATTASLTVSITTLTATDAVGVVGYMISESSTKPSATASVGWSGTKPTSYTFGSAGSKTLYAWAKDAEGNVSASRSALVTITLTQSNNPPVNRAPVANAGTDQTIVLPSSVSLSAAASSDPDNNPLTYSWSKISGSGTVIFSNSGSISPTATFSQAGTYSLQVSVSDGVLSSTDQVTVIANLVAATTYTLTSSAGSHGSITPLGVTTVSPGNNWVFVIAPTTGYQVANVIVDGSVVSLSNSRYTFTNVTANHTISVNFTPVVVSLPPPYVPTPIVNHTPTYIPAPIVAYTPDTTEPPAVESSNIVTTNVVPSHVSIVSSPSTTDPIYELSLLTATSTDMTFTPPPSMSEFLVSFAKENIDSAISVIQYVIDRVVSGLKNTVALPNSQ